MQLAVSAGPAPPKQGQLPPAIGGPRRVPIPSAQFVGRYMQRLEERVQPGKPEADHAISQEEVAKQKDVEQGGRVQQIKALLDVNRWSFWQIIRAVATKQHKALKFIDPQPGGGRRLTQWIMWSMYVYTGLVFIAYYEKSAGCTRCNRPVIPEALCDSATGQLNATEEAGGRRLLRVFPDGRQLLPAHDDYFDEPETYAMASERLEYTIAVLRTQSAYDLPYLDEYLAADRIETEHARLLSENRESVEGDYDEDALIARKIAQCKADSAAIVAQEELIYQKCLEQYEIKIPSDGSFYKLCVYQIVVMVLSSMVAAILVFFYEFSFKKTKVRTKKSITEKLRIVQFWKTKELFAMGFALCWISLCVFYLFTHAISVSSPEDSNADIYVTGLVGKFFGPFAPVFAMGYLIHRATKIPIGRFVLTLVPALYDFTHRVIDSPEDVVAARRSRQKRKERLRKEVRRLEMRIHPDERGEEVRKRSKEDPTRKPSKDF